MKKEEQYTGENDKWIEFNKRIVIRRNDGEPYLIRRTLLSIGKLFSIKYHQILLSDESCAHCHPWAFYSLMLKGGYYEWTPETQKEKGKILDERIGMDGIKEVKRWHGVGSFNFRPAKWRHSLELKDANINDPEQEYKPIIAHTLVLTLNVERDWGFYTKKGWIFWKNYDQKRDC